MATQLSFATQDVNASSAAETIEKAHQTISGVRLPFKTQMNFGPFRCRVRVLGNNRHFAVALTVFIGRLPFSAENRNARRALFSLDTHTFAEGAEVQVKSDNWLVVTRKIAVLEPATRLTVSTAILRELARLRPAADKLALHAVAV